MVGAFKVDEALPLLAQYVGVAAVDRQADVDVQGRRRSIFPTATEQAKVEAGASRAARR